MTIYIRVYDYLYPGYMTIYIRVYDGILSGVEGHEYLRNLINSIYLLWNVKVLILVEAF